MRFFDLNKVCINGSTKPLPKSVYNKRLNAYICKGICNLILCFVWNYKEYIKKYFLGQSFQLYLNKNEILLFV